MTPSTDDRDHWCFDGRHYLVTAFSDDHSRDGYGWELDDVAPAPGGGQIAEAFLDDSTGLFTFTAFTKRPLPFALIEQFITEAQKGVPRTGGPG